VEEAGDALARLIICGRRRASEPMHDLLHIGARLKLELTQCAKYDFWHLCGCSIVKIVQTKIHKARKFALDRSRVEELVRLTRRHLRASGLLDGIYLQTPSQAL
jgi:hypothetical protein